MGWVGYFKNNTVFTCSFIKVSDYTAKRFEKNSELSYDENNDVHKLLSTY